VGTKITHLRQFAFWLAVTSTASLSNAEELPPSSSSEKTILENRPWVSTRASAMGGALSTIADGHDGPFYNPAGIGGLLMPATSRKMPFIRELNFPFVSASSNSNSKNLYDDLKSESGIKDSSIGSALVDAAQGKRQYGRISTMANFTAGRMTAAGFSDYQIAAVSKGEEKIDLHYRSWSGSGLGMSVADPKGRVYFGVFSHYSTIKDGEQELSYNQINDPDKRQAALSTLTKKYSGSGTNTGLVIRLSDKVNSAIGLSVRDLGGTAYNTEKVATSESTTADSSATDAEATTETLEFREDVALGFSISPALGRTNFLTLIVEAGRLTDNQVELRKKARIGTELSLWGFGNFATTALRAGYNTAGASGGLCLNLGLIRLEASTEAIDVGQENRRLIERRYNAIVSINAAEFE
jgi:hypothetical protein